ncbi:MAG: prepilin peptidase [Drouetiella hepatica Uher 2000/2452]|jgi:leader peptidase (prepilin peptidase)/N-methyltransferase|uniref:Prepilin peptidase n=1 Tax=Drouetiella hepatica Uher 2000/2452 TaxID=904376 RepID=A0A951UNK1_9CYAN|nr:prepilin peptidase [Drouetiella hepatica Uher 2000/2452]
MELLSSGLTTLITFALGAAVGSFLNVVIYRIPAGLSLLFPPSRCPHCLRRLKSYDNVPVFGWLALKGRCRYCRSPIALRYPLVEAVTGALFVLVYWAFNLSLPTLGYWAFFSWLLALSLIDLDTMTLPNSLTQSGLMAGLLYQAIVGVFSFSVVGGTSGGLSGAAGHLLEGILGAVVGIWVFDAITILGSIAFGQTAMGGGDAKLMAMIGAWLGWKLVLLSGFLACAIGAFAGGGAIAIGLMNRRQPMPFGPFLAFAAVLTAFFGETILSAYMRVFFPTL